MDWIGFGRQKLTHVQVNVRSD